MKLKKIFQLTAVIALPHSLLSCGDEKKAEEKGASADAPAGEVAKKDHTKIGEEISVVMGTLMEDMSSITDVKSAQSFSESLAGHKATLKGLLEDAKALDPPTAEEMAAIQEIKDSQDAKGAALMGKMMKLMTEHPDAEAIGVEMQKIMADKEMDQITDEIEKIYGLKSENTVEEGE